MQEMQETCAQSLGREDPLEKQMATHSSILAWRKPWTEKPGELQPTGLQRVKHNWATNTFFSSWKEEIEREAMGRHIKNNKIISVKGKIKQEQNQEI